jgi:hypothetical protein
MRNLSDRLQNSPRARHLFFLVLTAAAILLVGYRFGTFDQVFHIPFLKTFADPGLYPLDPIVDLRWQNYSFFWQALQPFYELDLRLGFDEPYVLETVMFGLHVLSTYLTFWAVWTLSDALFKNPLTNLLAAASFIVPHIGQSGFPVIEFSLLNRTFVLPFVLFSLTLQIKNRTWLALALTGLLFNLHIITALFGLAMILADCIMNWRRIDLRQIPLGLLAFLMMAAPVLAWKAGGPPTDLGVHKGWLDLIVRSVLLHLFEYWGTPFLNVMTLGGLGVFAMYLIARRYAPPPEHAARLDAFFLALTLILLVQSLSMYLYPVTILMQLQLMRAGLFTVILAYISFAHYLATRHKSKHADWRLLSVAILFSPTPLLPPLLWGQYHRLPGRRRRTLVPAMTAAAVMLAFTLYLYPYRSILPLGVDVYTAQTDWYRAQRWARDHTPLDALFITPPQIWSYRESDWRVFSERSTLASLSDALEIALIPAYQATWQPRFEAVAPGALDRFRGDYFENKLITQQAYYSLTPGQLQQIAADYGASYLVVEKPNARPFIHCYENPQYLIYALDQTAADQAGCETE